MGFDIPKWIKTIRLHSTQSQSQIHLLQAGMILILVGASEPLR